MSNNTNSVLAFIGGIAVGAGVAIFLQSEKGKELRGYVADYLEQKGVKLSKDDFESLINSIKTRFSKPALEEQI